jgi:hypothetical protein
LKVLSGAISPSDFTASRARAISGSPIARGCPLAVPIPHASTSATSAAVIPPRTASLPERMSELLLDVPGFELGAPIQVEREARGDVEGFQEQHDERIRDRYGQRGERRSPAEEQLVCIGSAAGGCEPEQE